MAGRRSLDLAVPCFLRRDGQRRASAAWLTSSVPAAMQFEHFRLWRHEVPSFMDESPFASISVQVVGLWSESASLGFLAESGFVTGSNPSSVYIG